LPWSIFIQPDHRLLSYEQVEFYHPLFAYEAIFVFLGFVLLFWLSRSKFADTFFAGDMKFFQIIYTVGNKKYGIFTVCR